MAEEIPTIQVLDKQNWFSQKIIPLPDALPYPELAPSSLRLRTSVLGLTVNNFTYAALGTLLKWWDVHPLPPSTPAPYNDPSKYGRINAWGYAEVLESTVPSIPKGSYVWGYVPLGTLAQDLQVRLHENKDIKDQFFVTNEYRKDIMPIYNRYFVFSTPGSASAGRGSEGDRKIGEEIKAKTKDVAYDALVRVMHATAYLMADFAFSSDPSRILDPAPGPDDNPASAWTQQDADLSDATVLIFAPGSKVGLAFASLLRARNGKGKAQGRPRAIIGVSSESSKGFVEGTGIYDSVALTSADPVTTLKESSHEPGKRVVVFDFGGRAGVGPRWAAALANANANAKNFLYVGIGSEIIDPSTAGARMAAQQQQPPFKMVRVNADDMRRRAIKKVGEQKYWAEEAESWDELRKEGVKGFGVTWGEGMDALAKGWDRLARGDVLPSEGLAYKL